VWHIADVWVGVEAVNSAIVRFGSEADIGLLGISVLGASNLHAGRANSKTQSPGKPQNVRFWHLADIDFDAQHVCFQG
jgi:hypothetical protein